MEHKTLLQAAQKMLERGRKRKWAKVVSLMAAVVVFCTTYALILPAITASTEPICGMEEHTHGDDCFEIREALPLLRCTAEDLAIHEHTDDCRSDGGELICGMADFLVHSHQDGCYDGNGKLVCDLEEIEEHKHTPDCRIEEETLICALEEDPGHAHNETCYKQIKGDLICTSEEYEGHSHGDSCYATVTEQVPKTVETTVEIPCAVTDEGHVCDDSCITTEVTTKTEYEEKTVKKLVCEIPEDPGHAHDDTCYAWTSELTCTLEERPPVHIHEEACYETEEVLVCGKEEVEVHEHDLDCYGDVQLEDGTLLVFADAYEAAKAAWTGEGEYVLDPIEWADYLKCGKPEVREHIHGETCFEWPEEGATVEVLICGMEEHVHDDVACYPAQDVYYCNLTEHSHVDACYDAEGDLICELEEHVHDEMCRTAADTPEAEAAALMAMIDALPDIETVEAELLAYEEAEDWEGYAAYTETFAPAVYEAYDIYMAMDAETQALVTNCDRLLALLACCTPRTLEEPVINNTFIHDQWSAAGSFVHPEKTPYYQASAVMVNNGIKYVPCLTFVLVPEADYQAEWSATDADPRYWSAKTDANYLVAYCAEPFTEYSSSGAEYDSYIIDNSRFSAEVQNKLSAIITHSYPYLTYEEMKAELAEAYKNGDLAHDVANCAYCSENEYMTAVQTAIWKTVDPTTAYGGFTHISTDGAAVSEKYVNAFASGYYGHGENNATDKKAHCESIVEWLLSREKQEDLCVKSYDYEVTETTYGTYDLTVTADFNRPIIAGEVVSMQLISENEKTDLTTLKAGDSSFAATLSDLTEEELLATEVSLGVSGNRLQAYFFDSNTYQDFVSGLWEAYAHDLSFKLGVDEIDVAVTKIWADGEPEDITSISVQLFADGIEYGAPVQLNKANSWSYVWKSINKTDILGNEILYTIQEVPLKGYYSSVDKKVTDGENIDVNVWKPVTAFSEDGDYLIVGANGALGVQIFNDRPSLSWKNVDLTDAENTLPNMIWKASDLTESGGAFLSNTAYPDHPLGLTESPYYIFPAGPFKDLETGKEYTATKSYTYWDPDGHLYMVNGGGTNRYANHLFVSGEYTTSSSINGADTLTLYERQQTTIPASDVNFILTNTKIREDIEQIEVSIAKQWAGRPDNTYPEAVSVQLLQNGRAYDVPMTLDADNGWSYTWSGLPKTDNDDNLFIYTVAEVDVPAGYEAETTADAEKTYSFTVTNTWTPDIEIEVHKADEGQRNVLLAGAEFDLYLQSENGEGKVPIPGSDTANGYKLNTEPLVTDADGELKLKVAAGETYYLVETKAPAGFNLLGEPIGFTAAKHGTKVTITLLGNPDMAEATEGTLAILTVYNDSGFELPETGFTGWGAEIYQMGGAAVSAAAAIGLLYKKRRKKGGQDPS